MLWLWIALANLWVLCVSAETASWSWDVQGSFELESALFLNEAAVRAPEAGYKLRAKLALRPYWSDKISDEHLLELNLEKPVLMLRGAGRRPDFHAHRSHWDELHNVPFYVQWRAGVVPTVHVDARLEPDLVDYLKSLASLLQFQVGEGERNETDVTGVCQVLYETLDTNILRKIKRQCEWSNAGSGAILVPNSRRIMRYELGAPGHVPRLVFAEELHEVRVASEMPLGLRARAWHRLEALESAPVSTAAAAALSAASLLDALRVAEEEQTRPLRAYRLQPSHIAHALNASLHDKREIEEAITDLEEADEGTVAAARAHLRLVAALRAVPGATLNILLEHTAQNRPHRLGALLDAVAGTNTPTAHTVAAAFLQLGADAPLPLAERYLAALPAARPPHEVVAMDVLRLAENERTPPQLAQAARLSVGAMAAYAESPLSAKLIGGLSRLLAKCSDAECRALLIRALGNSRHEEVLSVLLDYAASIEPVQAVAAMHSLLALSRHLRLPHLDRVANIALGLDAPRPIHVRAAAIDVLISGGVMIAEQRELSMLPPIIYRFWKELEVRGPALLRHTMWTRLESLAEQNDAARKFLEETSWMRSRLGVWTARLERMAAGGTVRRGLGGAVCPLWLESTQLVLGGALRRGAVAVRAAKHKMLYDILELEMTTQGLQNIVGSGDSDSDDDDTGGDVDVDSEAEGPSAWLAVSVAGEERRPLTLFRSQAELLGHVWAGTASEPVTVVEAARAFHASPPAILPLLTGGTLIWEARSALALRLDAQLQISLWNRVAHALVELRAGGAVELRLETHTAGLVLRAEGTAGVAPALDVDANIDFYDRPTLCVMPQLHSHEYTHEVRVMETLAADGHAARRRRRTRIAAPGRTLALGAENERNCRHLHAPASAA